jgi:hypothetical protein
MRIVLVIVLVVAAVLMVGGVSRESVRGAVSGVAGAGRDDGAALKDVSSKAARGLAERVDGATERIDETASRKASDAADTVKTGMARAADDVRDRVTETAEDKVGDVAGAVRAAAAGVLRWTSDTVRDLASRVEP